MPRILTLAMVLLTVLFSACEEDQAHKAAREREEEARKLEAYKLGKAEGRTEQAKKSFDDGYSTGFAAGFQGRYPGAAGTRNTWVQLIYAALVIIGTVLIAGTSLWVLRSLVLKTDYSPHIFARILMAGLGVLIAFWLESAIGFLGQPGLVGGFRSFLLSPAPTTFLGQALTVACFLLVTLFFVHLCINWLEEVEDRYGVALLAFIWSIYLTLFTLTVVALFDARDVARYNLFPVSVGWVCGYGVRLAYHLLKYEARHSVS